MKEVDMVSNPFKPSAGHLPPILIGRETILADFNEALEDGPGAPGRLMRVTGPRGVGKTVMLAEFSNTVKALGWQVIAETARKDIVQRLIERLQPVKGNFRFTIDPSISVMGVGGSLGGVSYEKQHHIVDLSDALAIRLDELDKKNSGLLVTIDEAQSIERDDLTEIATAVQNMTIAHRNIAFVFAGLPSMASKWLNNEATTFIRRAQYEPLGEVPLEEVSEALRDTFQDTGLWLDGDPLHVATQATAGYPFMIQLVGYHIWRNANRRRNGETEAFAVTDADVRSGISSALTRLGDTVHGPELDGLSPVDKTYLLAMAQDDGPSSTSVIAERMGKDVRYASRYRARLLEAQVIVEKGYGWVDFAVPYLREYLREHAAYVRMTSSEEG
ncbi:ATP-binding protein [Bifidobacterium amazonense]|uniref:ATP-binding protein n=1 Tax=Bifidobacterium amazonense TaxID=2809027 RepID=A0ABS9VY97_9BIFI|nr:ATP-binding protein [Bifidobacterium amazonense]MCH9277073.1 ATP-binding protein [Bifidobacterium amazonense]